MEIWYVIACFAVVGSVVQWLDGLHVCGSLELIFCLLVDAVGGRAIFNLLGHWAPYCVCKCVLFLWCADVG